MESAIAIPMGPMIRSAFLHPTITAFSPVAAWSAPAFSILEVAREFVPTAVISVCGNSFFTEATSCLPMPPPWASIISIFIRESSFRNIIRTLCKQNSNMPYPCQVKSSSIVCNRQHPLSVNILLFLDSAKRHPCNNKFGKE